MNTVVGLFAFTKLPPAPLTTVQVPVPVVGVLAARVVEVAHKVCGDPASAAGEGDASKCTWTSSKLAVQEPLEMVHLNT